MTEREEIDLLLSQPEIVEWLELTEPELVALLAQRDKNDHDESARAA